MKSVSHIILATLLSTGTALAQETIDFDRHDADSDGFLTDQEWADIEAVDVDFATLDVDGDGKLSKAEVTAASEVDAESSPESGADLASTEVTAEGHSMAQQGQVDRGSSEEDPTIQDATSGDDSESETSMTTAESKSDSAASSHDASTADASGAGESESAVSTQPDVEVQGVDATAEDHAGIMAASEESGGEQSSSESDMQDNGMSQSQSGASSQPSSPSGLQQASSQDGSSQEGKQAFRDADADGDKRLSRSEVEDAGFDYVVMYFEPLDINRDSYLDESEWDQGSAGQQDASLYLNGDGPQDTRFERSDYEGDDGVVRFEEDFDTYDINDDGYLDESEAVESDWVDVNLFEYSDANDDGLIDIGEANDGFMEWGDDEEEEVVTGEDY